MASNLGKPAKGPQPDVNGLLWTQVDGVPVIRLVLWGVSDLAGWCWTLFWRRGWDSNPRATYAAAGFQDRCFQPLSHPSKLRIYLRIFRYSTHRTFVSVTFSVTVLYPDSTFGRFAKRVAASSADHHVSGCSGGTLCRSCGRAGSSRPRSRRPALNPSGSPRCDGSRDQRTACTGTKR